MANERKRPETILEFAQTLERLKQLDGDLLDAAENFLFSWDRRRGDIEAKAEELRDVIARIRGDADETVRDTQ